MNDLIDKLPAPLQLVVSVLGLLIAAILFVAVLKVVLP
jgi:hypothetical protein